MADRKPREVRPSGEENRSLPYLDVARNASKEVDRSKEKKLKELQESLSRLREHLEFRRNLALKNKRAYQ
jgi:hypothetical protein